MKKLLKNEVDETLRLLDWSLQQDQRGESKCAKSLEISYCVEWKGFRYVAE